jgi:hypothetical protein
MRAQAHQVLVPAVTDCATLDGLTLKLNFGGAEAYVILGDNSDGHLRHVTIRASSFMGTTPERELSRLGEEITAAIQQGHTLTFIVEHLCGRRGEERIVALGVAATSPFYAIERAGSWDDLVGQVLAARYLRGAA